MNENLSVIVIKETQHVLAALTCNAKADITAEAVAGTGLLVRGFFDRHNQTVLDEQFQVQPDALEVVNVEFDPSVLTRPREYALEEVDGKKEPVLSSGETPTFTLTATTATITVGTDIDKDRDFFIYITGANLPSPRSYSGKIVKETLTTTINLDQALTAGDYPVLVLLAGSPIVVETKTV
jgi:hypothetical protein